MSLEKYNEKRNFTKTKEPKGKQKTTKNKKLKFVIQHHLARAEHYDLRLEYNGVLLSWAVPKGLSTNTKDKRLAVMVEDHPLDYAKFEGVIPKGNYGAGVVEIFDKGNYIPIEDIEKGLKKGSIKFFLNGEKLKGVWNLVKTDEKNWLAIKNNDEFAEEKTKTSKNVKNPFDNVSVMLATLTDKIPTGKKWLFEIKYDGYRIIAFKDKRSVKLFTRNGFDYSSKFPKIIESLKNISKDIPFVLDGEIVSFDENGRSDFGLLQSSIKKGKGNFVYVVFDLLALNGKDLREEQLFKRKEYLENLLVKCPQNIMYSSHIVSKGKEMFNMAKKLNLEGIISKKIDSTYQGKRSEDWLKIKCYKRQEFVIGGYTTTEKNKTLSAILVGYYKNKKLIFAGKVGTGFSEELKKTLATKFKKLTIKESPFSDKLSIKANWLQPTLVAEIQYAEFTKENVLRQPSFIGLREDKNPKDVKLESGNGN